MKPLFVLLTALILFRAPAAQAEDYLYAPDDCAFQVIFPDEPARALRCDPQDMSNCAPITNYTHIIDNDATISVNISCAPIDEEIYKRYDGPVMKATLAGLARAEKLEEEEAYFHQHDGAKQALLIGAGTSGATPMIYTTHLWIAPHSILSAEARLIGESPSSEAHEIFAGILRSIGVKQETSPASSEEKESEKSGD